VPKPVLFAGNQSALPPGPPGAHALSLDRLLTNVNCRAGYKSKMKYFPFQRAPILSLLRTVRALRAYRESDSECWLLDATHEPIAAPLMENRINLTPGSCAKNWLTAARSLGFRTPLCSWRRGSRRD